MPKLQRAKTVACGLLRWDRCCIIVVSHWSKPAGQNMASLLVVVGFRTSHSMPKEESHVIFSKNLPLKVQQAPRPLAPGTAPRPARVVGVAGVGRGLLPPGAAHHAPLGLQDTRRGTTPGPRGRRWRGRDGDGPAQARGGPPGP